MIHTSEAIFAVSDVRETVRFYRDVLGFESEWFWEDPPTFGGVRWGKHSIMFCLQTAMQGKTAGLMHMFRVEDLRSLYDKHKSAGATIVNDIGNRPWGLCEYTVRDPNGYHLRFAGDEEFSRKATATSELPAHIRIEQRQITLDEYLKLNTAVGWTADVTSATSALERSLFFVVAIDERDRKVVGMVRVCGDRRAYTIWDMIVVPEYQQQKIGSALMQRAIDELRKIGPKGAFVGLFTHKSPFYERLGFVKDIGMHLAL